MLLENKISLVTGASRGIGEATAIKLASMGSEVWIHYNSGEKEAKEVLKKIEHEKGKLVQADITDRGQVMKMFKQIEQVSGRLDILVNNAGRGERKPFREISREDMERMFSLNAMGALYCSQYAASLMKNGGHIVNISTYAARKIFLGMTAYAAAKASLEAITRQMAKELGDKGIIVNGIAPGAVVKDDSLLDDETRSHIIESTPTGRLAKPEDIANLVSLFCLDEVNWMTGQIVVADGGASL